MGFSCEILRMR